MSRSGADVETRKSMDTGPGLDFIEGRVVRVLGEQRVPFLWAEDNAGMNTGGECGSRGRGWTNGAKEKVRDWLGLGEHGSCDGRWLETEGTGG